MAMVAATVESPPSKPSPTKSPGGLVDRHASSLELAASSLRLVYLNQPAKNKGFVGNQVITAKYNLWTFVPAFCYERFTQVSNFYFLLVGVGQVIPAITSTFGLPYSWLVLGVVLFVDAIFTAVEDYHRHRADAVMNARETLVYDALAPSCFRSKAWKDIVVGDVIQVKKYEAVPADILLLAVHEADPESPVGMCFIETKSLDGETNLKIRQALGCTFAQLQDPASIAKLPGRVACEHPNHDVNNFMGRFEPGDASSMIPIDLKNVVLRGCVIRNTPFVYGLVLNTGSDTKIMQASHKTPNKLSKAIEIINRGNFILMVIMLLLCILGAVWNQAWVMKSSPLYLQLDVPSIRDGLNAFRGDMVGLCIAFGYYWVLISSFVPITLYVSIAIVKSYQTYFMNRDLGMYYAATDTPAWVRNADLNDELGQITHIFSDKTGTLTANEMNFRKMCIHGRTYGRGSTDIGRATALRCGRVGSVTDNLAKSDESHPPHVEFLDPHGDFEKARRAENVHSAEIHAFLTHLSICHSVVLEKDDTTNETTFSASSPDELALVAGAAFFGYKFTERSNGRAVVSVEGRGDMEFQMLELIEFTSTRKRMSVVVRHPDGRILLLTKGADSIVFPRLARHSDEQLKAKTIEHMEMYAEEGLRTLVLAQRELGQDWYLTWSAQYKQVLANLDESSATYQAELAIVEQLEDEMERDLELLGATAVEDRLQNGVPQAISSLMSAGIKVWVLTGDKEETAINIAFACQLITNDMDRLILNMEACASDPNRLKQLMLEKAHRTRSSLASIHSRKGETLVPVNMRMQALVVDGVVLTMIYHYPLLKFLFLELAEQCCAVICCRVSPKQKAEVVSLVKNNIKGCRTLSIGDGANDVSMIQEAHVGVGISGHEGMQAVNASDFAIAQFAFLQRLLLVHGHWNYRRMARLVLYVVYKNILCWFTLFVLSLVASGSGTVYMNYNWLNGYNVFWTFLPIMILAIMEQETSATMAQDHPGLYHIGPHGYLLSVTILSQWVFEALYEGMVCALVPALLMGQMSSSGYAYSMYDCGGLAYTSLIVVGWAKLVLNTMSWNAGMHFAMWATLPFWFGSGIVLSDHFTSDSGDHSFPYQYTLPEFWMLLLLCIVLSLFRDFVLKVWKREWRPEYYHILQETEKYHLSTDTDWDPPRHRHNYKPFRVDFSHYLTSELHALPDAPWIELQQPKHRGFAFSIQPSENRHFNPVRSIVLAPIKRAVVRVLSPRSASQEEAAFWAKRKAEGHVYEYQRYQVFVGWSAPFGLTDPCHFGTRDMREGAQHGMPSPDIWMIDSSVGLADGKHWEYATKFRDFKKVDIATTRLKKPSAMQRKINKMVGRCVRRRRWILKPDYSQEVSLS